MTDSVFRGVRLWSAFHFDAVKRQRHAFEEIPEGDVGIRSVRSPAFTSFMNSACFSCAWLLLIFEYRPTV